MHERLASTKSNLEMQKRIIEAKLVVANARESTALHVWKRTEQNWLDARREPSATLKRLRLNAGRAKNAWSKRAARTEFLVAVLDELGNLASYESEQP